MRAVPIGRSGRPRESSCSSEADGGRPPGISSSTARRVRPHDSSTPPLPLLQHHDALPSPLPHPLLFVPDSLPGASTFYSRPFCPSYTFTAIAAASIEEKRASILLQAPSEVVWSKSCRCFLSSTDDISVSLL